MTESVAFSDQKINKKNQPSQKRRKLSLISSGFEKTRFISPPSWPKSKPKMCIQFVCPPTAKAFQSVLFLDVKLLSSLPPPPPQCCSIPAPGLYCIHRFLRTGYI